MTDQGGRIAILQSQTLGPVSPSGIIGSISDFFGRDLPVAGVGKRPVPDHFGYVVASVLWQPFVQVELQLKIQELIQAPSRLLSAFS